jgi:hypothetical protein
MPSIAEIKALLERANDPKQLSKPKLPKSTATKTHTKCDFSIGMCIPCQGRGQFTKIEGGLITITPCQECKGSGSSPLASAFPSAMIGYECGGVTRYLIQGDWDAILMFGKYKGRMLSELATSQTGCTYLHWMLQQEFEEDLKARTKHQLHTVLITAR